jgi:hypothetical protein
MRSTSPRAARSSNPLVLEITMRAFNALLVVLALALTGCAGDAPTALVASPGATLSTGNAAGAVVQRPWEGRCDVEAQITGPTTVVVTGTCEIAHLGRTTVVTQELVDWQALTFTNASTYTAANGDRLYVTGSGGSTFGPDGTGTASGTWTAVGGTGRFAGANGTAAYAESIQITGPSTAVGTYTLDGQLVY